MSDPSKKDWGGTGYQDVGLSVAWGRLFSSSLKVPAHRIGGSASRMSAGSRRVLKRSPGKIAVMDNRREVGAKAIR